MKTLLTLVVALLLLGAAKAFAPEEALLNPPLATDLSVPGQKPIRTTVTVTQQWVPRRGGAALAGYTPQGEAVTLMIDDDTEKPTRMGAEATYDVVGDALGRGLVKARRLRLVKKIPVPHDTVTITCDTTPVYTRTIGHWHQFEATVNGKSIRVVSQGVLPGKVITGYWSNDKFVTVL